MAFQDLLNKHAFFYGVNGYKFKLDNTIWEAVPSTTPDNQTVLSYITTTEQGYFERDPIAIVTVTNVRLSDTFSGYKISDLDGHVWVKVGTTTIGDWKFLFEYTPEASRIPKPKVFITEYDPLDQLFEQRDV